VFTGISKEKVYIPSLLAYSMLNGIVDPDTQQEWIMPELEEDMPNLISSTRWTTTTFA
jgi:hypothetical protein